MLIKQRPIVYGNISWWLGPNAEFDKTHKWNCFVRGPNNEDLSTFVEKVVFHLHESFTNPVRELYEAPYEVVEHGWGEFQIIIVIHFKEKSEPPLEIIHPLRLFSQLVKPKVNAPLIFEVYDNIIFTAPSETFKKLIKQKNTDHEWKQHPLVKTTEISNPNDTEDLKSIINALNKVQSEILRIKEIYLEGDKECQQLKNDVQHMIDQNLLSKGILPFKAKKRKIVANPNSARKITKPNNK